MSSSNARREEGNIDLVTRFFADWSRRDAELIASYLADDFVYQMVEGQPDIIGPQAFIATLAPAFEHFLSIDMAIKRIHAVGQIIVCERFDALIGADEAHSMRFSVASYVIVEDAKITVLKDYPIRGGTFELGDVFR